MESRLESSEGAALTTWRLEAGLERALALAFLASLGCMPGGCMSLKQLGLLSWWPPVFVQSPGEAVDHPAGHVHPL